MSREESRSIFGSEGETGENTPKVTKPNVHGNTDSSFGSATNVISVPRNTHRDIRVNPRDDKKRASVLDMRVVGRNKEDETSNSDKAEEDHEGSAFLSSISEVPSRNGGDAANNVRRNSHELRLVVRVSHVLHNGREEKGDRVQRCVDAKSNKHVNVDLPIPQCCK